MDLKQMTFRQIRELIVFTILCLVGLWKFDVVLDVLSFLWDIVFPFTLGGAIAFIINVPMSFVEKRLFGKKEEEGKKKERFARLVSLVVTLLLVIAVIVLVLFVLVPQLGETFSSLGSNIAEFLPKLQECVKEFTHNNSEVMSVVNKIEYDPQKIMSWAMGFLGNGAESMMSTTVSAVSSVVSGVANFFIAFSFAIYILFQKEKLHLQMRKIIFAFLPKGKAEAVLEVCSLAYKIFSSFLAGQCVEAVILGSMFVVSMTIFRLPYALLIGIIIAFTALIPVFGGFIGCWVGFFMIFMVSPEKAVFFLVLFLILQQIEGNLIYPHVVGGSVGLPSIWVLAAVSIGGKLMGIVGMLIFIPLVSVFYTLFREVVYLRLKKQHIKKVTIEEVEEYTEEEVEQMRLAFEAEHAKDKKALEAKSALAEEMSEV